jgi:hypothetical protein
MSIFDPNSPYLNKVPAKEQQEIDELTKLVNKIELAKKASSTFFDINADYELGDINVQDNINTDPRALQQSHFTGIKVDDYSKYGVAVTASNDFNLERAKKQSRWEQAGHAAINAGATILGEAISGTGAFIQLPKAILQESIGQNAEFENALMALGEQIQNASKEANPIYRENPNKSFDFKDFAWWMDNVPSIASSIGMLIPATGIIKGMSLAHKVMKAGDAGVTLAKLANTVDKVGDTAKYFAKIGGSAAIMRNAENFKESLNTFNEAKSIANEAFAKMSDGEFNNYKKENPEFVKKVIESGKADDRNNIAELIGTKAAWHTYKIDAGNVIFDMMQLAPLYRGFKVNTSTTLNPNKILAANAKAAGATFRKSMMNNVGYHLAKSSPMEMVTEGIEEVVNAIAGEEGKSYAKTLLGGDRENLGTRLGKYLADPAVMEQAFWGAIGGGVFAGGTRLINDIKSLSKNYNDTHSIKNRTSEINARKLQFVELNAKINAVNENINPFTGLQLTENDSKQEIIQQIYDDTAFKMGMTASRHGNANLLIEQLKDPNFIKSQAEISGMSIKQATEMFNRASNVVSKTEKYYQNSYNKLFTAKIPGHLKSVLNRKMTGLQYEIDNNTEKSNHYQTLVNEYKTSQLYKVVADSLNKNGIDANSLFEYETLLALKRDINASINEAKNEEIKGTLTREYQSILKHVNEKLKEFTGTDIEANYKAYGDQFSANAIENNMHRTIYESLKEKTVGQLNDVNSNIKEASKEIEEELKAAAKKHKDDHIAAIDLKLKRTDIDNTELEKIIANIDSDINNSNDKDFNAALSSLRASAQAKINANNIKATNDSNNSEEVKQNEVKQDPVKNDNDSKQPTSTNEPVKRKRGRPKKLTTIVSNEVPKVDATLDARIAAEEVAVLPEIIEGEGKVIVASVEEIKAAEDADKGQTPTGDSILDGDDSGIITDENPVIEPESVTARVIEIYKLFVEDDFNYTFDLDNLFSDLYIERKENNLPVTKEWLLDQIFSNIHAVDDNFQLFKDAVEADLDGFIESGSIQVDLVSSVPVSNEIVGVSNPDVKINKEVVEEVVEEVIEDIEEDVDIIEDDDIKIENKEDIEGETKENELDNLEDNKDASVSIFIQPLDKINSDKISDKEAKDLDHIMNTVDIGDEVEIKIDTDAEDKYQSNNPMKSPIGIFHSGRKIGYLMTVDGNAQSGFYTVHNGVPYYIDSKDGSFIKNDYDGGLITMLSNPEVLDDLKQIFAYKRNNAIDLTNNAIITYVDNFISENLPGKNISKEGIEHLINVITFGDANPNNIKSIEDTILNWHNKILNDNITTLSLRKKLMSNDNKPIFTTITSKTNGGLFFTKKLQPISKLTDSKALYIPDQHNPRVHIVKNASTVPNAQSIVGDEIKSSKLRIVVKLAKVNGEQQTTTVPVNDNTVNGNKLPVLSKVIQSYFQSVGTGKLNLNAIYTLENFANIRKVDGHNNTLAIETSEGKYYVRRNLDEYGNVIFTNPYDGKGKSVPFDEAFVSTIYRRTNLGTLKENKPFIDIDGKTHTSYTEYIFNSDALVSNVFAVSDSKGNIITNAKPLHNADNSHNLIIKVSNDSYTKNPTPVEVAVKKRTARKKASPVKTKIAQLTIDFKSNETIAVDLTSEQALSKQIDEDLFGDTNVVFDDSPIINKVEQTLIKENKIVKKCK